MFLRVLCGKSIHALFSRFRKCRCTTARCLGDLSINHGICFGQQAVDEKSNEITAVPKLLDLIRVNGAVISLDALHCQRKTAQCIVDKGGDYVIPVKGNQLKLAVIN